MENSEESFLTISGIDEDGQNAAVWEQHRECECGAPLKIKCAEGHDTCEIVNWYIPKAILINMISKNIQKVFKDYSLDYNICIVGGKGYIVNGMETIQVYLVIVLSLIKEWNMEMLLQR